jgi:hypothetical protein
MVFFKLCGSDSLSWVISSGYVFEGSFAQSVAEKFIVETCKF